MKNFILVRDEKIKVEYSVFANTIEEAKNMLINSDGLNCIFCQALNDVCDNICFSNGTDYIPDNKSIECILISED